MPTISCPHCDARFRSKKDLTGRQVRCPRCDAAFVVDEEPDQIPLARKSTLPPRAAPSSSHSVSASKSVSQAKKRSRGKKRKASRGGGFPKPMLFCLGIALAIGAGWYGLQAFNADAVPIPDIPGLTGNGGGDNTGGGSGIAGMLGLADTPESLMEEFTDCGRDLKEALAAITDEASAQQAVERFQAISGELVDIRRRASLATPIPEQELSKRLRKFYEDEQLKTSHTERIAQKQLAQNPPFENVRDALQDLDFLARSTKSSITEGLQQLPEPRNEFETIEYERVKLQRQVRREVMQVTSAEDVAAAAEHIRQTAPELQALADRKSSLNGKTMQAVQAQTAYLKYHHTNMTNNQVLILKRQGIAVEPMESALAAVSTADSNIGFAQPKRSTASTTSGEPPQAIGRRGRPAGAGRPGGGGRPTQPTGPATAGEIVLVLKADVFGEKSSDIRQMQVIGKTRVTLIDEVRNQLKQYRGSGGSHGNVSGGQATLRFPYDGDPQTLAEAIRFGKVESVDATARQITMTLSPDFVQKVRKQVEESN